MVWYFVPKIGLHQYVLHSLVVFERCNFFIVVALILAFHFQFDFSVAIDLHSNQCVGCVLYSVRNERSETRDKEGRD